MRILDRAANDRKELSGFCAVRYEWHAVTLVTDECDNFKPLTGDPFEFVDMETTFRYTFYSLEVRMMYIWEICSIYKNC
jgi:hypothetical protein